MRASSILIVLTAISVCSTGCADKTSASMRPAKQVAQSSSLSAAGSANAEKSGKTSGMRRGKGNDKKKKAAKAGSLNLRVSDLKIDPVFQNQMSSYTKITGVINGYVNPVKGLRITLSGTAVAKKLYGCPGSESVVRVRSGEFFGGQSEQLVFSRNKAMNFEALVTGLVPSGKPLELSITMRPTGTGKGAIDVTVEPLNSKTGKVKSNLICYVDTATGQEEEPARRSEADYRNPNVPPEVEARQRALINLHRGASKAAGY